MKIAESYIRRYPHARASTILQKQKCQEMAEQIKREIAEAEFNRVDSALSRSFRTFHLNVWRSEKRGEL